MHVADKVAGLDVDGTVVAPFVGISDLVHDGVQLFERLLLGGGAHPRQRVDVLRHGLLDLRGHVGGFLFQFGAEGASHEFLAERFAELLVHQADATLPSRTKLWNAAQCLAEEVEILVHKFVRQVGRDCVRSVPAQVGLDVGEVERFELFVEFGVERGLRDVERILRGQADAVDVNGPIEIGRHRL